MKHSELKQLIKEEIRSALNEGLFDRFQKSDNKLEQAKKEIDQTDFNYFFIQPASFRIDDKERSMITSQLKKRVTERLPTLISLFPNLVSGNALYDLKSNVNGELIYGVTLGNLGGYITNDYLIIDNDIAKTKLKKNLKLDEGLFDRFRKKPLPNYKIVREFPLSDLYKNQNELDPLIQTHPDPDYHNFEYLTKNYKKFSGFVPDWSRGLSDDKTISAIVFPPDDTIHFIAKKYL